MRKADLTPTMPSCFLAGLCSLSPSKAPTPVLWRNLPHSWVCGFPLLLPCQHPLLSSHCPCLWLRWEAHKARSSPIPQARERGDKRMLRSSCCCPAIPGQALRDLFSELQLLRFLKESARLRKYTNLHCKRGLKPCLKEKYRILWQHLTWR